MPSPEPFNEGAWTTGSSFVVKAGSGGFLPFLYDPERSAEWAPSVMQIPWLRLQVHGLGQCPSLWQAVGG